MAWVVATLVSILIASAAVGSVRSNVSDKPSSVLVPAPDAVAASIAATSSTIGIDPAPEPTVTPTTEVTTPEAAGTTSPSTSAVAVTTTSSTTPTPENGEVQTFSGLGGSMSVEVHSDHLVFLSAVPSSGYTVKKQEIESKKITIEFTSPGHRTKLTAKLEHSEVEWKAEEEDNDDD